MSILEIIIVIVVVWMVYNYYFKSSYAVIENLEKTGTSTRPTMGYAAELSVMPSRGIPLQPRPAVPLQPMPMQSRPTVPSQPAPMQSRQQATQSQPMSTQPRQPAPMQPRQPAQQQGRRYDYSMEPSVADIPSPTRNVPVNDVPNAIMTTNNDWVTEHNRVRAEVGQKPVKWNQTIANGATEYARRCVFQHANQRDLGENLAMGGPAARYDDKTMVKLWESEKKDYRHPSYPRITSPGETGHYTQMINKNVNEIGCGCANCGNSRMCVCRYDKMQYGNAYPY